MYASACLSEYPSPSELAFQLVCSLVNLLAYSWESLSVCPWGCLLEYGLGYLLEYQSA